MSFNQDGPKYMGSERLSGFTEGEKIGMFGACYDGTTSFRPGARGGPDAIRNASYGLETYSPEQDRELNQFLDLGNLDEVFGSPQTAQDSVYHGAMEIVENNLVPFMLGGEHSLTPPAVQAVFEKHPTLFVVQFDAHADLRFEYLGEKNSHACAMRRVLDFLESDDLVQVGIRSGTKVEFEELRSKNRLVPPDPKSLNEKLEQFKGRPVYLSVDLDIFDPAIFPGTGTPEPGGIFWKEFSALLDCLASFQIVGMDVMELSPQLDTSGCSSVLAAKAVREMLILSQ